MSFVSKYTQSKSLSVIKACLGCILVLTLAVSWQILQSARKDRRIARLVAENESLKQNLQSIDGELLQIKDTASDVRLFQKELVKVIKDIDQKYAPIFSSTSQSAPSWKFAESLDSDAQALTDNAKENIFLLTGSQDKLLFETASLLGNAVSIKDALQKTPSMIPVAGGRLSSPFGARVDPFTNAIRHHNGVDIAAPIGTPVLAAADGVVKLALFDRELGNKIVVVHKDNSGNKYETTYGHLSEILTKKNARVGRGDKIGEVGKTGLRCKGAHLHFGVSKNGVKQDPKKFMLTSPVILTIS